jgi:hypothetical protein
MLARRWRAGSDAGGSRSGRRAGCDDLRDDLLRLRRFGNEDRRARLTPYVDPPVRSRTDDKKGGYEHSTDRGIGYQPAVTRVSLRWLAEGRWLRRRQADRAEAFNQRVKDSSHYARPHARWSSQWRICLIERDQAGSPIQVRQQIGDRALSPWLDRTRGHFGGGCEHESAED